MGKNLNIGSFFSTLGKSLQLPIAVLPLAGILVGIGLYLGENIVGKFLLNSGLSVFDNLAIIFALGLAIGFAKDHHGAAVLAAFVGHAVLLAGIKILDPITSPDMPIKLGVFSGIIIGPIAGLIYNRFSNVKLPDYLAFFAGRRAVPIVTGFVAMALALVLAFVWPPVQKGINSFGNAMTDAGPAGSFAIGFLNRMFLPIGLHQILNAIVWFDIGEFTTVAGTVVKGDLARFWAGDPTAGKYMVGFFPIMMFGLPGACLAMYLAAKPSRRNAYAGMFLSMVVTSFVTGITEPIEFSFMFLAFPLYVVHAVLTGLSMAICEMVNARLGFNFSAGAIDMVLSWKLGSNQVFVLILGAIYFVVYFVLFTAVIKLFNLKTPGREDEEIETNEGSSRVINSSVSLEKVNTMIDGLGGKANIINLDACATRLRVEVKSSNEIKEAILKSAGAKGVINSNGNVQVIIGPEVNEILEVMQHELKK